MACVRGKLDARVASTNSFEHFIEMQHLHIYSPEKEIKMAKRSYSLLQALDYVMHTESQAIYPRSFEDEETHYTEADSITSDEKKYQPVPHSSFSMGEDNTGTSVEAEQLITD